MAKFNVIVIGGGLGGLTAGAMLTKMQKKVLLLEQHYVPGGCATTFKRKDFLIEVGLHEMDGLFEKDIKLQIFDLLDVNKNVKFEIAPEFLHVKYGDSSFTFPHGFEEAKKALTEKFPEDEKGLKTFFKILIGILDELPKMPMEKWKKFLMYPFMPLLFPNVVKTSMTTIGAWLDKNIKNEELKLILTTNILYYGDDPYNLSMLYFGMAQSSYIGGGGHFVKGGSQNLSDHLADYIQNNGGQVLLGRKVEEILIENGKTAGVRYRDTFNPAAKSEVVYADAVVVNAAMPSVSKMLPNKYGESLKNKIKNMKESCSLFSIYMGFDIDLKTFGIKHYSNFFHNEDIKSLKDTKANYQGSWENKSFVFVDYSQVDSGLAPAGKSVGVVCAADYYSEWENLSEEDYKEKKEKVAQMFLKRLESFYPGILNHLVYYEVGTARTIQKYTLNPKGTPYGFAQTVKQSGMSRVPAQSSIKNMYYASAWTFPGGGFTGSILSGFLTAIEMWKKIKWNTVDDSFIKDRNLMRLLKKEIIAGNTLELTYEKPADFYFKAGQYALLKMPKQSLDVLDIPSRPLSIASHPDEPELRFAMRISDTGFKKSCMQINVGEISTVYGPMGNFVVEENIKNIAFIIAGIGITPIMSILKDLEKKKFDGNVVLFYSNKTENTATYHKQLQNINIENYKYVPVYTSIQKRIDLDLIKNNLQDLKDYNYFLVGTPPFLTSTKEILLSSGVNPLKIKEDNFG